MNTTHPAERCALWKRGSDDKQETDNQNAELAEHVARHDYEVARTFDLPDLSGSKGRPRHVEALEQVIADMTAGVYTVLVVVHSSRLDRRDEDEQLMLLLRIKQAGGRVESVREPSFGTMDTAGRLVTFLAQFQNAEYSRVLADPVNAGNARIDAQGGYRGGRAPFGYRVSGTKHYHFMEPDPVTAPIVVEIFLRIVAGQTTIRIQAWLASLGYEKRISTITEMVRRKIYWNGKHEVTDYAGVTRIHLVKPLVDQALFELANANLAARSGVVKRPRTPRKPDYSGALFCGQCGGVAYRSMDGEGKYRRRNYRCRACKISWNADVTDARVGELMAHDLWPEAQIVIVPGSDWSSELERIKDDLRNLASRGLPEEEEDEERVRLRREKRHLESLPVVLPSRRIVLTGRTMGTAWTAMSHAERVAYMRGYEFRVELQGRGADVVPVKTIMEPESENVYERDEDGNDHYAGNVYPDEEAAG
jgi:DNA invertase Pin-like site-specific DNA recombinase